MVAKKTTTILTNMADLDLNEVAPPSAKHERMVKHIKKSYKKDGKLTDDEKSIAYATAWKNYNKVNERYSTFDYTSLQKARKENEAENKFRKDRMQHGKKATGTSRKSVKYKDFVKKAEASKTKLRKGEYKKYVGGKLVSNKA